MSIYLFRLIFKGPTHFGLAGIGLEAVEDRLGSDSLTSALINACSILEGPQGARRMAEALAGPSPPFVLTSLYPFGPDPDDPVQTVEVLVRPLVMPPVRDEEIIKRKSKELKKIPYLGLGDIIYWIGKEPLDEARIEEIIERSKRITQGWWQEELRPRVALDRASQNSALWSQAAYRFASEQRAPDGSLVRAPAGLYGLVRFHDEDWKEPLARAFRLLGDTGLGGERTYGMGLFDFGGFEVLPECWNKLINSESRYYVLLSLYYPSKEEREGLRDALVAWDFVERRGFITSGRNTTTLKRKRVRFLVEGSIAKVHLKGSLVDVTPDGAEAMGIEHKVYRSGLAFFLPQGGNS